MRHNSGSFAALRSPILRDYQARTLLDLLHGLSRCPGETFTVMFPRQSGKNEVSAALVTTLLLANAESGGIVIVCAPTYEPQARISQERTWRALSFAAPLVPSAGQPRQEANMLVSGRARAIFLSASPAAHSAGHTASLALIADEAQDIDADWFDRQFRPMAASTGATTILFGTPWNGRSLLEREASRNRDRDAFRLAQEPFAVPFHHQVSWETVAATRPRYGEYVRAERDRLGANHPLFLSQYELVAGEGAGHLLSAAQIASLVGAHPALLAPVRGERYVAGLDFGGERENADATVLSIARVTSGGICELVLQVAWEAAAYAHVEQEVLAMSHGWRFEHLVCDATGLGAPLTSRLERALGSTVTAAVFTASVKSALGYGLIAAANTGRLRLPADDGAPFIRRLIQELSACTARFGPGRTLHWGDARKHDDHAVSLALCLRAAEMAGESRVAKGRSGATVEA